MKTTKNTTAILATVAFAVATAISSCAKENGVKPTSVKAINLHAIERTGPDSSGGGGTEPPIPPK